MPPGPLGCGCELLVAGWMMSPEQSVLCCVSSHFAKRDIVRPAANNADVSTGARARSDT